VIDLVIDTHGSYLNIAVLKDDIVLSFISREEKEHSTNTLLAIEQCLKNAHFVIEDVKRIYVVNGPGSFTGVRIGVTIAKTLAYTLKKEIVPISSLMSYALSCKEQGDYIIPMIDARRDAVYAMIIDKNNHIVLKEQYLPIEELLRYCRGLTGKKCFVSYQTFSKVDVGHPKFNFAGIVAYYKESQALHPHLVKPNYLKKTEAEENLIYDKRI